MARIKFRIEVGALVRKGLHSQLEMWKADIQYNEPEAVINITENKGFLESYFTFQASNLSDSASHSLQDAYNRLSRAYEE